MGVSTSIGPVSGIDYGKLITGLTGIEQKPIDDITTKLGKLDKQNTALLDLSTLLTGIKVAAASFASSAIFRATNATTANPSVLNATAGIGTPVGNYSFNVQQLASSTQVVTQGFANSTTALGLSGNITLQLGGGDLNQTRDLRQLNGGAGVARGSIKITDRSGAATLVDLSHAVNIQDVADAINSSTGVSVGAALSGDHLVLTDNSGGVGTLSVANAGGATTATDLGLTGPAAGGTLTGTALTKVNASTSLDLLNDGLGVRTAGLLKDFTITGAAGAASVSLSGAKTLADVVTKINAATLDLGGGAAGITAAISADGKGLTLTDGGGGPIAVTAVNSSLAAYDLGILGSSGGASLVGDAVTGGLTGPLLKSLNGGNQGQAGKTLPTFGTIVVNGTTVDLTNARTLTDVTSAINASGAGVTAAIDNASSGITLSSNAASFTVADGTSNLASFLKVAGTSTAGTTGSSINSGDLRLQYVSNNTALSTLNGGSGIKPGSIKITGPALVGGASTSVTLDLSTTTTVGDVLARINSTGLAITARINDTGDGVLITQTAGTTAASITDLNGGTTATNLGISGTLANNKLDGTLQKTIAITATDTLSNIASKLNSAGAGIAASIINDGSAGSPYRLSISSRNSGKAGRLIFNGSGAGLSTTELVHGEDAVLIYGGNANGTGGLVTTSSSNAVSNLVPSLTLNLTGVGSTNVSVTNNPSKIQDAVQGFVDSYNKVVDNITEATAFNASDQTKNGVLFGNANVQLVQDALGRFLTHTYSGNFRGLASVGIKIEQDGKLSLDTDKLSKAITSDPDGVRALFTTNVKAVTGGAHAITTSTQLSTFSTSGFSAGNISIVDGFGAAHAIDLSTATTVADVISKINAGTAGTVTASLNATSDGLLLTQVGGGAAAQVNEVNGGTTAATLNIKGTFANGVLNGALPYVLPSDAKKGVGATLSDLLDRFTNGQTGLLFDASNSIQAQESHLKERQLSLATLLLAKKNRLIQQFAQLEVTLAQLQQQSTALTNFKPVSQNTSSK